MKSKDLKTDKRNIFDLLWHTYEWHTNEELKKYIEKNPEALNQKNKSGDTPLLNALKNKRKEYIIELLINEKVLNEKNQDGDTPLIIALKYKFSSSLVRLLIND